MSERVCRLYYKHHCCLCIRWATAISRNIDIDFGWIHMEMQRICCTVEQTWNKFSFAEMCVFLSHAFFLSYIRVVMCVCLYVMRIQRLCKLGFIFAHIWNNRRFLWTNDTRRRSLFAIVIVPDRLCQIIFSRSKFVWLPYIHHSNQTRFRHCFGLRRPQCIATQCCVQCNFGNDV